MCQQCKKPSFKSRFFADFMSRENESSYNQYKDKKEQLFKDIKGKVLEIGPGTGVNLRFLGKQVQWTGIEPNVAMHQHLKDEAHRLGLAIELYNDFAESTTLPAESMDYVISTIVLCSVKNVSSTLSEIKRILKPTGKFIFLEHEADKSWTFRWIIQKIVPFTPWRYFSDGCTPGRELGKAIMGAGFEKVVYQKYMQQGEGLILAINRPHLYGWAQK